MRKLVTTRRLPRQNGAVKAKATINTVERDEFLAFAHEETEEFMRSIDANEAYVVKSFYPREQVLAFRRFVEDFARASEPSWHPCLDGVPDYHRINDEYEKSWVKARMHSFYFHRFNENSAIFDQFKEIFALKNQLAGEGPDAYYDTVPSDGVISRVVSHQYPRGGGYLAEHIDPTSRFALIQTIIQASEVGSDFDEGGLYFRETEESDAVLVDPHSEIGDLLVLSPAVRHGVAPIDPDLPEVDWNLDRGRWMILPVVIRSDYNMDPETKPKSV
jgi:hypothetical protein